MRRGPGAGRGLGRWRLLAGAVGGVWAGLGGGWFAGGRGVCGCALDPVTSCAGKLSRAGGRSHPTPRPDLRPRPRPPVEQRPALPPPPHTPHRASAPASAHTVRTGAHLRPGSTPPTTSTLTSHRHPPPAPAPAPAPPHHATQTTPLPKRSSTRPSHPNPHPTRTPGPPYHHPKAPAPAPAPQQKKRATGGTRGRGWNS